MKAEPKVIRVPAADWDMSPTGNASAEMEYTPATDAPVEVWANNADGEPVHYATHELDGTYTIHDYAVAGQEAAKVLALKDLHREQYESLKRIIRYQNDGH